jgi:hypothetical protein
VPAAGHCHYNNAMMLAWGHTQNLLELPFVQLFMANTHCWPKQLKNLTHVHHTYNQAVRYMMTRTRRRRPFFARSCTARARRRCACFRNAPRTRWMHSCEAVLQRLGDQGHLGTRWWPHSLLLLFPHWDLYLLSSMLRRQAVHWARHTTLLQTHMHRLRSPPLDQERMTARCQWIDEQLFDAQRDNKHGNDARHGTYESSQGLTSASSPSSQRTCTKHRFLAL